MLGVYAVLDLHCHILPNLDDGAQTMDESLEMAALAASSGVHYIFATPRCNTRDPRKNYRSAPLIAAYETLQQALDDRQIPITILSGAEVLARGDFEAHLEAEDFMTLNGSRYLLTEFYFDEAPAYMEHCLQAVEAARLVPVIAHPERYFCIQRNPGLATDWAERGRILQINKGSLLGTLGQSACLTAALLLRRAVNPVIASDAHRVNLRSPHMGPLLELLDRSFPEIDPRLVLHTLPLKIAKDETV